MISEIDYQAPLQPCAVCAELREKMEMDEMGNYVCQDCWHSPRHEELLELVKEADEDETEESE